MNTEVGGVKKKQVESCILLLVEGQSQTTSTN